MKTQELTRGMLGVQVKRLSNSLGTAELRILGTSYLYSKFQVSNNCHLILHWGVCNPLCEEH